MIKEKASSAPDAPSMEARLARAIDSIRDYAIFMLDVDGHIETWNAGARELKGYEAHEVVGKHFSMFYPPEDVRAI